MLFKEALFEYEKYIMVTRSNGTLNYFLGKKRNLLRYLGKVNCEEIDKTVVLQFIIDQRNRNPSISNVTINKYLKLIRQILKYSCSIDFQFEKLSETKKIIQTIPSYIIDRILNHYRINQGSKINIRNYLLIRLLNETGLRVNELVNLKLIDFDLDNNIIHVKKTKTNNERYVFYTEETRKLFNKYIIVGQIDNYVFISFKNKKQLTVDSVETLITRLKLKLNIEISISPHKWRHTFATRFIKKNGNIEVLRQILGHSSLRTTQKYLHLDKDSLFKEYMRVNNL